MYLALRIHRLAHKWTLSYVADQVGTAKTTIQMLETGQRKPSYEILVKLEDLFQMSHRELFREWEDHHNV